MPIASYTMTFNAVFPNNNLTAQDPTPELLPSLDLDSQIYRLSTGQDYKLLKRFIPIIESKIVKAVFVMTHNNRIPINKDRVYNVVIQTTDDKLFDFSHYPSDLDRNTYLTITSLMVSSVSLSEVCGFLSQNGLTEQTL